MSLRASADDIYKVNQFDQGSPRNICVPISNQLLPSTSSAATTMIQVEQARQRCSRCACELLAHPNAIVLSATAGDPLTPHSANRFFVAANETERKTVAWCNHATNIVLLASEIALLVKNARSLHSAAGVASVRALRNRADDLALKPSSMQNDKLAQFGDYQYEGRSGDTNLLFKIGEFQKQLSNNELQSLMQGESIRASFVDCYFRYLLEYEHPDKSYRESFTPRIYCLSTSNSDQIRTDPDWVINQMQLELDFNAKIKVSLILVPIAIGGHVTLAAITFTEGQAKMQAMYFDSLGDEPPQALLEDLYRIVGIVFGAAPLKIQKGKMTKQRGPDCGLHIMFQGRELVRWARSKNYVMQKATKDMSNFRMEVYQKLKSHCS